MSKPDRDIFVFPTPHCNDDLNKIIEQDISMVDLSRYAIWACKIIKMKIFPWTVLVGRLYTGRKIRQIGQNGLCMLAAISKRANGMILTFMKIGCLMSLINEFIDDLLCSFQFHQNILKYTVHCAPQHRINFQTSYTLHVIISSLSTSSWPCCWYPWQPFWLQPSSSHALLIESLASEVTVGQKI